MTKITHAPWKEVVVHETIKHNKADLLKIVMETALAQRGVGVSPFVTWADGVIFVITHFPETADVVKDKLKGVLHFSSVMFASFEDFKPEAKVTVAGSEHTVRISKVDVNPIFTDLVKFLKTL